ncbi:MAG: Rne/Rng family ribonuclease [Acidobacteriota bacterium]
MSKEMIVSVNGREKKIAILENGKVTEFYIERGEENSGVAGNVYKGRVMRVLPGMQSAFVDVGLERDAFLYVSDFFDEDEEIERIVMEKSKKSSPEQAKSEADEIIATRRLEREKQMESVQEITEPLGDGTASDDDDEDEIPSIGMREEREPERQPQPEREQQREERSPRGRRGGRGRKSRDDEPRDEPKDTSSTAEEPKFEIEFDNSGFERISDDDGDTGEMFKDAYMQDAIVHAVRSIEFDMESTPTTEVGSLLGTVTADAGGFERIADEDDDPTPVKGRKKSPKSAEKAEKPAAKAKAPKAAPKKPAAKPKAAKGKKAKDGDALEDAEASVRESDGNAEMAVRRGGRGRRRGGAKPKGEHTGEDGEEIAEGGEGSEGSDAPEQQFEAVTSEPAIESAPAEDHAPESEIHAAPDRENSDEQQPAAERTRGGRSRGGRGRSDRQSSDRASSDRPSGDQPNADRPERLSSDRPSGDRPERSSSDRPERPSSDRPTGDRDRPARGGRNDRGGRGDRPPQPAISDLLREGQEILVQIAKEPIAKKGARITSHIALPGRFLVYMPTIEHLGVSRKIESANERGRLRTLIQRIRQDDEIPSGGFIVRTAGIGISEEDLRNDAKYLVRAWQDAKKNSEKKRSPALVHQDLDLVQRILRDQLSDDFTAIRVDSEEEYLRTVEFINLIQPRSVNRIKLYTRDEPILDYYGVQEEIDKALKPRVWLKSGGYLVINQTEALVAIDVNTGKFVGKGNARLEDTITRTNMEAVDEIARQIRLRDLGGIIVLDLIDMEDRRNRHKVSQALQEALSSDRSPTKVLSFNDFGLIIMTRKRVKQSLERTMCAPCDYCEGSGWVKSPITLCYEILSEARRLSKNVEDVRHTTLRVHPDVAKALRSSEREVLDEIEAYLGNIDIASDKSVHQGQFDFAFI